MHNFIELDLIVNTYVVGVFNLYSDMLSRGYKDVINLIDQSSLMFCIVYILILVLIGMLLELLVWMRWDKNLRSWRKMIRKISYVGMTEYKMLWNFLEREENEKKAI